MRKLSIWSHIRDNAVHRLVISELSPSVVRRGKTPIGSLPEFLTYDYNRTMQFDEKLSCRVDQPVQRIKISLNYIQWCLEFYHGSKSLAWNLRYDPTQNPICVYAARLQKKLLQNSRFIARMCK